MDKNNNAPVRVLLVDDSMDNRLLIKVYLKKLNIKIDNAQNGEEAYNMFMENKYDLVLMDLQMPVMDGFTSTESIRAYEEKNGLEATMIIALTAYSTEEVLYRAIKCGCNEYITKPVKKATIINIFSQHFKEAINE